MEIWKQQSEFEMRHLPVISEIETRHLPAISIYGIMWSVDRFKRYGRLLFFGSIDR